MQRQTLNFIIQNRKMKTLFFLFLLSLRLLSQTANDYNTQGISKVNFKNYKGAILDFTGNSA